MADSESKVSQTSPVTSPSAVTIVTSLNAPPSDVMEAVNQTNEIIPALFALPSESGDTKKLKLCKRVGWLRDGVFTTGFMEINIKEAKQKGIFNQPRHVTLVQGEDSFFQSQVIQGQNSPSNKQLRSLVLSPGTSTMGLIGARGKVIPKRITVVKNVPFANKSPRKLVALSKAPSLETSTNKARTSADTATGHQNQTEGNEVAKHLSMVSQHLSTQNVQQDSADGLHLSSHTKEPLLVEDQTICVKSKPVHAASTGAPQSCPAKKIRKQQNHSPRITRAKTKDGILPKVNNLGSPQKDTSHLQSWSNPKLDLLKMDIDFSRHNVLQMEGLIELPCDPTPSEFNCFEQKKIAKKRLNFSGRVQEVPELCSLLSKSTANKHLENQTTAESEKRTVMNRQCISECSNRTSVHWELKQNTDAVRQSEHIGLKEEVDGSSEKREKFQKRKFDEAFSASNCRAAPKLNNMCGDLSCGEPAVKYTKFVDPELCGPLTTNQGSSTDHSQHYDPDQFMQKGQDRCGQVSLSSNQEIFVPNKRTKCVSCNSSELLITDANTFCLHDGGAAASSQKNTGISTNLPVSPMQTLGRQTLTASHVIPASRSTSVNSVLELRGENHLGNNSRKSLSTRTISETNNERPSLPSDSSDVKTMIDQASDGVPLLQIGSVYSLSPEEAKRLFPKASIETPSKLVETNQRPVDAASNIPISSSSTGPVVEPSAPKVNLEPLDLLMDSQPTQSQTSDATVKTVSSTALPSSGAISNSTVTSTNVHHTMPLPPDVLKLDSGNLPGKVQKNPTELIVVAPPITAQNLGQNVIPKTLYVSHSRMTHNQIEKAPSIIVPLTQTVTVNGPPGPRNLDIILPSVPNISNVPLQSSFRRAPSFHHGSLVECNATSIPTNVLPTAASDVSCSTYAGSVCTSIPSSSSVGSICSTNIDFIKKPTQQEMSTASNRNTSESKGLRTFVITTTHGRRKITSFPSTVSGAQILSQMTQDQDNHGFFEHLKAKKTQERLRNNGVVRKPKKVSKFPRLLLVSDDVDTKKDTSLNFEIDKNPKPDLGKRTEQKRKKRLHSKGHKGSQEENTTTSLGKYLQMLTQDEDLGDKSNTSCSNLYEKSAGKMLYLIKEGTVPSSQPKVSKRGRPPTATSLKTNRRGNTVPSQQKVSKRGRPPANTLRKNQKDATPSSQRKAKKKRNSPATLMNPNQKGTTPSSQSKVCKKGRPPAIHSNTNQKGTTPSSQSKVSKKGRPPAIHSNTDQKGTTPSSQSNVSTKGRPPAIHSNADQKGTTSASQSKVCKKGRPPAIHSNADQKGTTSASQSKVCKKGRPPAIHSNTDQKGTTPTSQSNVSKKGRPPAIHSNADQKGTTSASQSKDRKKGRPAAIHSNTDQKGTTPASQSKDRKKGRPSAIHSNTDQKGTTPSSQSNVSMKGRQPAIHSNTDQKSTTSSSQMNVSKKRRTRTVLSTASLKGALPPPQLAVSRERSMHSVSSTDINISYSTSSLADVNQKLDVHASRSSSIKRRKLTSPATQSSLKKTNNNSTFSLSNVKQTSSTSATSWSVNKNNNSTFSLSHVKQTSSTSATSWNVNKNNTAISFLSDIYRESSSPPSYIFREERLMQLKKIMHQKEQDIEDMKRLRQLEVREKLSDPELCDL